MKVTGKLITSALFVIVLTLHGCAPPPGQSGMETFGRGVAGLVLSPLMIIAGLAQGLAFLPYTVGAVPLRMGWRCQNQRYRRGTAAPCPYAWGEVRLHGNTFGGFG